MGFQIEILVSKIQFHLKGKYFAPNVATVNQTQDCASIYQVKNLQIAFNEINIFIWILSMEEKSNLNAIFAIKTLQNHVLSDILSLLTKERNYLIVIFAMKSFLIHVF